MNHISVTPFVCFALLLSLVSCSEDSKLTAKFESQKIEMVRLKGELLLIEEKLKNLPPDVTKELATAREEAEKIATTTEKLETEVASLEASKRQLQIDYDAYKAKYQIK